MIQVLTTLWLLTTPAVSEDPTAAFAAELAPHVTILVDPTTSETKAQSAIDAILRIAASRSDATPQAVLEALWSGVLEGSHASREAAAKAMTRGQHTSGLMAFAKSELRRIEEALDVATAPEEDDAVGKADVTTAAIVTSQNAAKTAAADEAAMSPAERRASELRRATQGTRALAYLLEQVPADESVDVLIMLERRLRDRETRRAIDASNDRDAEAPVYVALATLGRRDAVMVAVRAMGGMRTGKPLYSVDAALRNMAERRGVTPPEGSAKKARFRWSLWSRKYEGFFPESLGRYKPAR